MWLLDHNLPIQLLDCLQNLNIQCDSTVNRGWQELSNGKLVSKAVEAGFTCILTKDKLFSQSASNALSNYPEMAIVLIKLAQCRGFQYIQNFQDEWKSTPIVPQRGKSTEWPTKR
ncbi:MAG: DUF5615 family PIN-like protein [Bdellovibrionales bacterium]|nr:DUF5615 family PIN-like protein [Bdellovibrionales bacterium]